MANSAERADRAGLMPDAEVEQLLIHLDSLLGRLEKEEGPVGDIALEAVEALTAVYGEALSRIVNHPACGPALTGKLVDDKLVAHLLVLHGLHPDPPEQRIQHALEEMRPYLDSHGGDVQLESIDNGVATVTVTAGGCASSASNTRSAVQDAVLIAAPELDSVEATTPPRDQSPAFIPVEALLHPSRSKP